MNRFRNITIHFAKTRHYLQLVVSIWGNVQYLRFTQYVRFIQFEFLDVFYCGHVTYQIWAWFETFKENVNRTNTVNFQCPLDLRSQKRRFWDFLSNRFVQLLYLSFSPLKVTQGNSLVRCSVYIVCPSVLSCSNLKLHQTLEGESIFIYKKTWCFSYRLTLG